MNELIKYEAALPFYLAAKKALVKARSVDEVLKIKNTAEAARVYAMQANDEELVNNAVEIKLHAKQRAGQMLQEGRATGQIAKAGDNQRGSPKPSTTSIGLTKNESSEFQRLASVPEKVLTKAIEVVKERDGALTEAAVKRELPTKIEQERDARIAERKKQQGNNVIPEPPLPIRVKKEIALSIANTGYRELMKKHHPDVGGDANKSSQLSEVMTWLRRTIEGA